MAFNILNILEQIVALVGAPGGIVTKLVEGIDKLKSEYPDVGVLADKVTAFLVQELSPYTDVTKLMNTLKGIALDIATGATAVDPDAWKGSV